MIVFHRCRVAALGLAAILAAAVPPAAAQDRDAMEREALALNRQAGELSRQGRIDDAIVVARRGLALSEAVFGKVHANIAADLITLANLYERQGDFFNAQPLITRAIGIDTQIYGAEHPEVAIDKGALAMMLDLKGDVKGAEQSYRESINTMLAHFDFKYMPSLTEFEKGLGDVLAKQNRHAEALKEWAIALEVLEERSPERAMRLLVQMAEAERARGNAVAAEEYLVRAQQLRNAR
jgi:tetratricopeptide (TPR) repeat protein